MTPRQVALLIRVVIALVVVGVGAGIFVEYFEHRELYPSRKRAFGSSQLHWVFWLAFFLVLYGVATVVRHFRKGRGEGA